MNEPACTETAPCFACLRCFVTLTNILATDPNVRAHMTGVETRPAWKPAWKHAAEAGGLLKGDGSDGAITIKAEAGAVHVDRSHVATLPDGDRVELPAGTVLREALPPEPEDDRPTLGEQIHDEHDRATHADGSCCLCDPASTDLTERAGLPREMAPADRIAFDRAIRPEHMPPASPEDGAVLAAITRPSVIGDDGSIREIADEDKFPSVCLDRPTPRPPPVSFDPRAMAERASYRRTVGQGFQEGFEEGVRRERARAAIADHAKPRT